MKIIQKGNPDAVKRRVRFTCRRCACIFEADFGEYRIDKDDFGFEYWSCECPTCGSTVKYGPMRL